MLFNMHQPPCAYLVCGWHRGCTKFPKTQKSRNSCLGAPFPLHQSNQEPCKKNQPPNRRRSLTCSFFCRVSCVPSITVGGSVVAQTWLFWLISGLSEILWLGADPSLTMGNALPPPPEPPILHEKI